MAMIDNNITLPFGRRIRVGNFVLLKHTRSLGKKELAELRKSFPKHVTRELPRSSVPFIRVETASGTWAVEFSCMSSMYELIDHSDPSGDEAKLLTQLFLNWYADTNILGDPQYVADKARALNDLMERMPKEETPEQKAEDDKVLDEVRQDEEAKAVIRDMAGKIGDTVEAQKGGQDG